jgi:hypothetical protein
MLCEHNPHRRCNVNFAPKYLVSDLLKAKCEAPIRVEIIDRSTGVPLGDGITDVHLEVTPHCLNALWFRGRAFDSLRIAERLLGISPIFQYCVKLSVRNLSNAVSTAGCT